MDGKYTIKELYDLMNKELPIFEIQEILENVKLKKMSIVDLIEGIAEKNSIRLISAEIDNEDVFMPAYLTVKLEVNRGK